MRQGDAEKALQGVNAIQRRRFVDVFRNGLQRRQQGHNHERRSLPDADNHAHGKRLVRFRQKADIFLNQSQRHQQLIEEAELGIENPAPHGCGKCLGNHPGDDDNRPENAQPLQGLIQHQRHNGSKKHNTGNAKEDINQRHLHAVKEFRAGQVFEVLKLIPPLVPLNDVGVAKRIPNQIKDGDCQNENKKHNRRYQINIRFYLSANATGFFVPFHDFTSCS